MEVDLKHLLADCSELYSQRASLPREALVDVLWWTLAFTDDIAVLRPRVRFLGLSVSALVHAERNPVALARRPLADGTRAGLSQDGK